MNFITIILFILMAYFTSVFTAAEEEKNINDEVAFPHSLSIELFGQKLDSKLTLQETNGNEVNILTDAPIFTGASASYRGIGVSYYISKDNSEDETNTEGFKWTIPWNNFLFECYSTKFKGAFVEDYSFRTDITSESLGLIVTWSNSNMDFSSIYGLERGLSLGPRDGIFHTYYIASIQQSKWQASYSFHPVFYGDSDYLAFNYINRIFTQMGIGTTYVKYFDYFRFSFLGDLGVLIEERELKYEPGKLPADKSYGLGLSIGFGTSISSDIGLRELGKYFNTHFNYGFSLLNRSAGTISNENKGTILNSLSEFKIYLGAIW